MPWKSTMKRRNKRGVGEEDNFILLFIFRFLCMLGKSHTPKVYPIHQIVSFVEAYTLGCIYADRSQSLT